VVVVRSERLVDVWKTDTCLQFYKLLRKSPNTLLHGTLWSKLMTFECVGKIAVLALRDRSILTIDDPT
jgi:hypothetical protein